MPSKKTKSKSRPKGQRNARRAIPKKMAGNGMDPLAVHDLTKATANVNGVSFGMTANGRAMSKRALHPCDETAATGCRIPDAMAARCAAAEHRWEVVISKEMVNRIAPPGTTIEGNYSFSLLITDLPDMPVLIAYVDNTTGRRASYRPLASDATAIRPGKFRLAYSADSVYPVPLDVPTLLLQADSFRGAYQGVTGIQVASSINNQGTVHIGQFAQKGRDIQLAPLTSGLPVENRVGVRPLDFIWYDDIPRDTEELVAKIPTTEIWEARHGFYNISRWRDPVHLLSGGETTQYQIDATNTATAAGKGLIFGTVNSVGSEAWLQDTVIAGLDTLTPGTDAANTIATTAGAVNFQVTQVFVTGLDETATFRIKLRAGLEIVPQHQSIMSMFVQEAPEEDETALKAVHAIQRRIPYAFHHRFNSWGLLAPLIKRVAATVLPSVIPWAYNKVSNWLSPGIPAV